MLFGGAIMRSYLQSRTVVGTMPQRAKLYKKRKYSILAFSLCGLNRMPSELLDTAYYFAEYYRLVLIGDYYIFHLVVFRV